jgi:hypothetical protein
MAKLIAKSITLNQLNVRVYHKPHVRKRKDYWVKGTNRKPSVCTILKPNANGVMLPCAWVKPSSKTLSR